MGDEPEAKSRILGAYAIPWDAGEGRSIVAITMAHRRDGERIAARLRNDGQSQSSMVTYLVTALITASRANRQPQAHAAAYALLVVTGIAWGTIAPQDGDDPAQFDALPFDDAD